MSLPEDCLPRELIIALSPISSNVFDKLPRIAQDILLAEGFIVE